uniref:MYND-type domain-containing protein n=1 Tax=Steinernema glaseri TaxID=37863 RepID=A0A1I7XY09_9BILA
MFSEEVLDEEEHNSEQEIGDEVSLALAESRAIVNLQKHWLQHYDKVRVDSLIRGASKLFEQFKQELVDEEKQLREDLEKEFEQKKRTTHEFYRHQVDEHLAKQQKKYDEIIAEAKRCQWCCHCGKKARLSCCYNCSYCSPDCQSKHWPVHRNYCRRQNMPELPSDNDKTVT